ncbi:MAG: hypothetical protein H7296_04500 [Bacteroidia bacterium]|nr:hypothetical protein [Bacteroidia bacterium]
MNQNKFKYPVYVILVTILLLFILSFFKTDFKINGIPLRKTDIFSDLRKKKRIERRAAETMAYATVDSTIRYGVLLPKKILEKGIIQYSDSQENSGLLHFFKALTEVSNGKRKKIRIAYFGDSMIEGDMISQELRKMLQKKFGGKGVGFVPVTSVSAPNRSSVQHTFSDNWKDASFQNSAWGAYPFGFSGHVFYTKTTGCWFSLKGVKEERLKDFTAVKIFYGKADSGQSMQVNEINVPLVLHKAYNIINVTLEKPQKEVMVNMGSNLNLAVYGASLESDSGITLDNYSFRGISGVELSEIPGSFFRAINEAYPYDLVILHYGPNLLFKPELIDFSWFAKKMEKTFLHLKKNLPQTSFLVIGTADKSSFTDGIWQTAAGVEPLIETQNKLAKKHHCAFWNLYANMGGENSMVQWAEKKPIRAGKDYTHLNQRGAYQVADMLYKALLLNFNDYEKKH